MRLLMFILSALLLTACQDNGPTTSTETRVLSAHEDRNLVRIRNLMPTEAVAGEAATYTFDVDYNLTGYKQGVINLGFNTTNANSYTFVSERKVVDEGHGTVSFTVTATAVKWNDPYGFKLTVSLSEYPHPSSWTPLATDAAPITVSEPTYSLNPRSGNAIAESEAVSDQVAMAGFGNIEECFNDSNLQVTYCNQF